MLKANKNLSIQAYAMVGEKQVVSLNAVFYLTEDRKSVNENVMDQGLYDVNKKEMRKDIADFRQMVDDVEDSLAEQTHD